MRRLWVFFFLTLALQGWFWSRSLDALPRMEIVPPVPSEIAVKALSFGDGQAFFRILGFYLQGFGDSFGRYTPLKEYDYALLKRWFTLLDTLDNESALVPSVAAYYYSQTQNRPDVRYVVEYLRDHSEGRLETKWWWRTQAVYIADHLLEDTALAAELAKPLVELKGVPVWVNQLPAFVYEKRGEFDDALAIMEQVRQHGQNLKPGELNFIRHFIEQRLRTMERKMPPSSAEGVSP